MGHADHEISDAFSKFDCDGNKILDQEEQEKMKRELEDKRVSAQRTLQKTIIKGKFWIM